MNTLIVSRSMGVFLSAVVMLAAAACDEGTKRSSTGSGGDDTTASSSSSSVSSGSGSSSSGTGGSSGAESVIDNMEDNDGSILAIDGRKGAWYIYNDMTATGMQAPANPPFTMTAVTPPRDGSAVAAKSSGMGFTTWGAGFGFDLNNNGTTKSAYDASAYKGVTFWAKIGAGTVGAVRFNVGDKNTTPEAGICAMGKCSDDFGDDLTLTETWGQFTIPFAEMKQVGWSGVTLPAIDASALYYVHFQAGASAKFDIWIDDIAFIE